MSTMALLPLLPWCFLLHLQTHVQAGPMAVRSSRWVREVYPEIEPVEDKSQTQACIVGDVVYGIDEAVPAEEPCLKCTCQISGVACETIQCGKSPGCKAVHMPNKCCPEYQCECEHESKIYANGERIESPPGTDACKVCYCRGGQVQCGEISCYVRTDCEPKRDPGQCCPKYDHCPPIDRQVIKPSFTFDASLPDINTENLELWPITRLLQNGSEDDSTTAYGTQDSNKILDSTPEKESATEIIPKPTNLEHKITIHEIIPAIKEIPITAPAKSEESDNDLLVIDSEPDSSEISEVFQQPPPVLKIGDKLLFLKQGSESDASTPASVITIVGAEGLQRGWIEDSAELHEHSLFNNSNDLELKTSESTHILSLLKKKPTAATTTTEAPSTTTEVVNLTTTSVVDENSTLETTNVDVTTNSNSSEDGFVNVTTEVSPSSNVTAEVLPSSNVAAEVLPSSNVTEEVLPSSNVTEEDLRQIEENPAYPPIPDVMLSEHVEAVAPEKNETFSKILPEVLEIRNNKTIPGNTTNGEWLKNEEDSLVNTRAALPEAILKETAPSDLETTTEVATETTEISSTDYGRSVETIEETGEESGEATTSKDHASLLSNENASVEVALDDETTDMLAETEAPLTSLKIDDVEVIKRVKIETTTNPMEKDVEMVDVDAINNSTTTEAPEKLLELRPKVIGKRENSPNDEADEVFRQLNFELNADSTERSVNDEEDEKESDAIFKELLEETSTPKTTKKPRTKEEETLQKVSDAIAKLTLRGGKNSLDGNVLGVISNFFTSQFRGYKK